MENDPQINPGESIQSSAKEKREARSAVRQSLREQRAKLKELRQGMRQGQDLGDDIDSCMGEIDLLLKELQAIEEGGHATFLEAKELIAPKKNVSSKKTNLRDEASDLHKEIKHLDERLYLPGISDEEREKMNLLVSEKSARLKDLEEELSALRQYNHTRFVHARDESRKNIEQERLLEELEQRREELGNRMLEALEKADEPEISKIQEELNALHEQKDKLLENGQDPFLRESAE